MCFEVSSLGIQHLGFDDLAGLLILDLGCGEC